MTLYFGGKTISQNSKIKYEEYDGSTTYLQGEYSSILLPKDLLLLRKYCFSNNTSLQSISIPNSVTSIGLECFSGCTSLQSITFEEPCQITELPYASFLNCPSLESITIPSSVESIHLECFGYSWDSNTTLQTITINKPTDSISGAPWGAANATIVWNG